MSDLGRIHAFSLANCNGHVVYERFYDRMSEIQKAEMRTALGQCSRDVLRMPDGHVGVGNFRGATVVYQKLGALVYYCVGSGEYDELAILPVIQTIMGCVRQLIKAKRITELTLTSDYDKLCTIVDEVIHEGIVDCLDVKDIVEGVKAS
eukprot:TRINITY_DN11778_c0_g1_i1.p1 TRINITY_DN11778_c0_g1~~TRINITY_DN11778_c0_g1_i1.p1  ORF type:complete len:149 (+),score=11.32 TRINITY_DN11778_c0_g1_i1:104-550(+)